MRVKTEELTGTALDWAVSYCVEWSNKFPIMPFKVLPYSSHWAQGGPIIEREGISVYFDDRDGDWYAKAPATPVTYYAYNPLVAAMRCYVASKLGDEVEMPIEEIN